MYYPYFRGKQFELITIREMAPLLAKSEFVPIIEPVREALKGLERTLAEICRVDGKAIVIVNPFHGDHAEDGVSISALLKKGLSTRGVSPRASSFRTTWTPGMQWRATKRTRTIVRPSSTPVSPKLRRLQKARRRARRYQSCVF